MKMTRWTPFDGLLADAFGLPTGASRLATARWRPAAQVTEHDDRYVVSLDLPGVQREDLQVEIDDGVLALKGERKVAAQHSASAESAGEQETDQEGGQEGEGKLLHSERFNSSSFLRRFTLPRDADSQKLQAVLSDGVLEVQIPRVQNSAQLVEVQAG